MNHSELLQATADALHETDFEVYYSEGLRRYFDFIAVRDFKIFVKTLINIDNLGLAEGSELKRFADAFSSQSFVVGERAGMEPLREDVVYQRFNNPCVNLPTFKKILNGESASKFTKRGQFLISIDGGALRALREEKGLSQEELASILDCTGQTIYRIEKQNRIQEELFEKLVDYFGKSVEVSSVELKEPAGRTAIRISDPIKKEIVKEYFRLKLNTIAFETPIDFALEDKPVLTPVSLTESELRAKQRITKGLEDILECGVVHITKEQKKRRIPAISFKELHQISSKEEILDKSD